MDRLELLLLTKNEEIDSLLNSQDMLVVLAFCRGNHLPSLFLDQILCNTAGKVSGFAKIGIVDGDAAEVQFYVHLYTISEFPSTVFFFNHKQMRMNFLNTDNSRWIGTFPKKKDLIKVLEAIYIGAKNGKSSVRCPLTPERIQEYRFIFNKVQKNLKQKDTVATRKSLPVEAHDTGLPLEEDIRLMESEDKLSKRSLNTSVMVQELMHKTKDAISIAQDVVYWQPPEQALERVKELVWDPSISKYDADEGLSELRQALIEKLQRENNLNKVAVMITAGAKQAFVNVVLTLCDPGDSVVMFAPYYFNAYLSFQMTGITNIRIGTTDSKTLQPDIESLERTLSQNPVPKLVTVVNPGNPSGAYIPEPLLLKMSDLCKRAGAWFVVDNTYEYFMYDGLKHSCIEDDHVINIFSFSKAYGMRGWRVGYIAYPEAVDGFAARLLKFQDNIPICACIISQRLALHSLEVGPEWVRERVQNLVKNRNMLVEALAPLGEENVKGGRGAIYLWAKLPENFPDDYEVVRWLVKKHHVVVIPGSVSGGPGYLRVSFGGLKEADCEVAAYRLKKGLEELMKDGMVE